MKYFGTIVIEFEDDNLERAATRASEMGEYACEGLAGAYGDASPKVVTTAASGYPMIAMTPERIAFLDLAVGLCRMSADSNEDARIAMLLGLEMVREAKA